MTSVLIILVNLSRIITAPDDRVLVIYGAGHVPLLSQFIHDCGFLTLEPIKPYLH
jgi:hypothetical protein